MNRFGLARLTADIRLLLSALVISAGLWVFVELVDALEDPEVQGLDQRILFALRTPGDLSDPWGPPWFETLMRDFTALGGFGVLAFLVLSVCGFLLFQRKLHSLLLTAFSAVGGLVLSEALKAIIDRPRPSIVPHLTQIESASFPSGHSMNSAVVYLTLGALLASLTPGKKSKIYLISLALTLTVLIGASRVYLGVHYPTDVLAGWCVGVTWAVLCWTIAWMLRRQGMVTSGLERED